MCALQVLLLLFYYYYYYYFYIDMDLKCAHLRKTKQDAHKKQLDKKVMFGTGEDKKQI